jgi:hypothetical protein
MTIIQYDLIPIDIYQKVIPIWVKDGGYFQDSETKQIIGVANEEHLPNYIKVLTEEELLTVVLEQHEKQPHQKINDETRESKVMTSEEVASMVNDWLMIKREEHG